jgi:tungstate transport system substrate-binding protein
MPQGHEVLLKKLSVSVIKTTLLITILSGLLACTVDGQPTNQNDETISPNGGRLRLATTTSLYDTGLWDSLEPMFEDRYGIELDILTGGTGKALEFGRRGDVDVLTIHDKTREEEFVAQGYGIQRYPLAYNYFLIVGPGSDPAGIKDMDPEKALLEVMKNGQANPGKVWFVSRGDNSGTHAREKLLWKLGGQEYESVRNSGSWYLEAGAGMGAILTLADEKSAYTLADIGTYLAFKRKLALIPLVDSGESLLNVYSVIAISPERHPDTNADMANTLIQFLTSDEVQDFIGGYGLSEYGTLLFTPARGQEPQ